MRSLRTTTKSRPRSPQLEKTRAQQWRPNAAKKLKNKKPSMYKIMQNLKKNCYSSLNRIRIEEMVNYKF